MEPKTFTITKDQLATALATWKQEADAEGWPERTDPERWSDTAEYLLRLMGQID